LGPFISPLPGSSIPKCQLPPGRRVDNALEREKFLAHRTLLV
jgi:hypothetical protein